MKGMLDQQKSIRINLPAVVVLVANVDVRTNTRKRKLAHIRVLIAQRHFQRPQCRCRMHHAELMRGAFADTLI